MMQFLDFSSIFDICLKKPIQNINVVVNLNDSCADLSFWNFTNGVAIPECHFGLIKNLCQLLLGLGIF